MKHSVLHLLLLVPVLLFNPCAAGAQTVPQTPGPALLIVAGTGHGTTWDDEGLLGRGLSVAGGAGVAPTPRLSLVAFVDRVNYHRDVEWLTFSGRMLFVGAELGWRFRDAGAAPYLTAGAGAMNDSGMWVRKTRTAPGQGRDDEIVDRRGTRATLTASAGADVSVAARFSVRAGVRFYSLLQTGDDLFPHLIVQPIAAAVLRF